MQSDNTKKDLIRKYINQDCNPAELEEMKKLMLLPDAQQLFDDVLSENWDGLEPVQNTDTPELNKKLSIFYERLATEEKETLQQEENHQISRTTVKKGYLKYAAVLAFALLSTVIYWQFKKTPVQEFIAMREQINANGQRSKIILPDSSEVFLGAGSKLTFPEKFKTGSREVTLEGEAFFQVTKNPRRPFIIHTSSVQTKVLGTSFKIQAFKGRPLLVSVATGKVRVDDYAGSRPTSLAVLTPGQQVTYFRGTAVRAMTDINDIKSWKDGQLVFHQRRLNEITAELERWYNVKFVYQQPAKAKEEISIVLQADVPLNKIIKVLSATGHFNYKIINKQITIN